MKVELLRQLPSVENLLQTVDATRLVAVYGRPATLEAIRGALARAREAIGAGKQSGATIGV
jgi:hypothetical protein